MNKRLGKKKISQTKQNQQKQKKIKCEISRCYNDCYIQDKRIPSRAPEVLITGLENVKYIKGKEFTMEYKRKTTNAEIKIV